MNDPPGTYEGQTALHIAIISNDFDMVRLHAWWRGPAVQTPKAEGVEAEGTV